VARAREGERRPDASLESRLQFRENLLSRHRCNATFRDLLVASLRFAKPERLDFRLGKVLEAGEKALSETGTLLRREPQG
jgi:hypothetical protein